MFLRHLLKTRNVYDHRHKTLKAWHVSSLTNIWNGQDTVKRGEITHTRIKDTVPTLGNKLRDKLQNKTQIETPDASADSSTNSSVYKTVTCVSSTMQVSCGWHRHKTWYRTRRWVSHDLSVCLSVSRRPKLPCCATAFTRTCAMHSKLRPFQQTLLVIIETFYHSLQWPGSWQILSTAVTLHAWTVKPGNLAYTSGQGYNIGSWLV